MPETETVAIDGTGVRLVVAHASCFREYRAPSPRSYLLHSSAQFCRRALCKLFFFLVFFQNLVLFFFLCFFSPAHDETVDGWIMLDARRWKPCSMMLLDIDPLVSPEKSVPEVSATSPPKNAHLTFFFFFSFCFFFLNDIRRLSRVRVLLRRRNIRSRGEVGLRSWRRTRSSQMNSFSGSPR